MISLNKSMTYRDEECEKKSSTNCPTCNGNISISNPYSHGYGIQVDAKTSEIQMWSGDECLAIFKCNYCPICGAKFE